MADGLPVAAGADLASIRTQASCSADGMALLADGRFEDALGPLRLALAFGDALPSTVLNLAIAEDRSGNRQHADA